MKKNKLIMVVLLLVVSCVSVLALTGCALFEPSPAPPTKPNVSINVDNLKDQSLSSVVANNTMTAVVKVYCEWSGSKSAGAGFVMNKDGYVVTNAHCILKENVKELDPRAKLSVEFVDGSRLEMSAVKYNPILDIAILKPKKAVKTPFEFLTFADTSTVVFGQQAYTWGNPENISFMFSSAMVSNPGVLLEPSSSTKSILLDSTINHGNSGGALLNDKGQVIGVVFARLESEGEAINQLYGVGCAIQSTDVMNYIDKEVKIIDPNASYTKAV